MHLITQTFTHPLKQWLFTNNELRRFLIENVSECMQSDKDILNIVLLTYLTALACTAVELEEFHKMHTIRVTECASQVFKYYQLSVCMETQFPNLDDS